jgi:hypothetical protein
MRIPAVCLLAVFAGCYRYTPATNPVPVAGSVVRLELSSSGAERLTPVLGQNTTAVDGTILAANDTAFIVSMAGTQKRDEQSLRWAGERVTIPRNAVQSVATRTLDKKKTLLVAGFAILGAVGLKLMLSLEALAGGDDGGGITPPPP